MLTHTTLLIKRSSQLLPLLLLLQLLLAALRCDGATVTWGQVNKYASTLHAQDVYLADANVNVTDVVYGTQNPEAVDAYTITAVHAYDMTPPEGDGGRAQLLGGGVGQQYATVRFQRHRSVPVLHYQLVIYGVEL
ncbi:uncharacterized protein [Drosophila virilis]|uniref:Uncharacterized protein, isoform A n=1 Tax=Drosophila virilis TaxID=7244 RepID=B4LMC0_DROVI|nr:uncharacterized protein LOC6626900 [Drosophila virilis]XP_015030138.1 uncharacterized protein LOC6626900 [Drosophila virilis]XP_015030139.1 uncharacterized protein LOC6626900 [Drosophila virilis]EDW62015.1 uncharacterized protein Dvir_GJ22362, isoform A [Drosophila virilis]KRF80389.1 uncharacterized protein Dvir_GJ22362, isoform C [Drosophila virilis]KRF80390.1 uncharacterized protein Dvir_GJ22362, isoform D [Drosophila virilis]